MSKELENKATMLQVITCLNGLLDRANHDEYLSRIGKKEALKFLEENQKYADIIKSNLQRLESIDKAKPSEALECLKELEDIVSVYGDSSHIVEPIKQALLKAQEQEKVLEIIKEKRIDLESFYTSFVEGVGDYSFYKRHYGTYGLELLAEEEFNLLKSVF